MEAPNVARSALDGTRADRFVRGSNRRTVSKGGPVGASLRCDACEDDSGVVGSTAAAACPDDAGRQLGRAVEERRVNEYRRGVCVDTGRRPRQSERRAYSLSDRFRSYRDHGVAS